jgi:hypothetical protein
MTEELVPVDVPHGTFYVKTKSGDTKVLCTCMMRRIRDDEIVEGVVPDDIPEYNVPKGAGCHPEWRPEEVEGESTSDK